MMRVEQRESEATNNGYVTPFDPLHELRWIYSAFYLMAQRLSTVVHHESDRHQKRRMQREGNPLQPMVEVITLWRLEEDRARETKGSKFVDWQWQWEVRGHWRNQYIPSTGEHTPVFVEAYIKGPKDKPLKPPGLKLFSASRQEVSILQDEVATKLLNKRIVSLRGRKESNTRKYVNSMITIVCLVLAFVVPGMTQGLVMKTGSMEGIHTVWLFSPGEMLTKPDPEFQSKSSITLTTNTVHILEQLLPELGWKVVRDKEDGKKADAWLSVVGGKAFSYVSPYPDPAGENINCGGSANYTSCTDREGRSASVGQNGSMTNVHVDNGFGTGSSPTEYVPDSVVLTFYKHNDKLPEPKDLEPIWTDIGVHKWHGTPEWAVKFCEDTGRKKKECKKIVRVISKTGKQ